MTDDLSTMSRKQLEKLAGDVEKALKDIEVQERKEAREAAEKAAAKFGFSLSDLTDAGRKGGKGSRTAGTPKFKNPENPAQTWTGKGRQPQWYKKAIEDGAEPESLAI